MPSITANNHLYVHGITGTSTLSNQEIKPTDPMVLSDLLADSDDATARITSIKLGSQELLAQGGSAGIRVSAFNKDGVFRGLFAGIEVSKNDPLVVSVVHAGSGTNTTTFHLVGRKSKNAGCET